MGVDMAGIDLQRGFEVMPGLITFAEEKQQIGEIDVAGRIAGMMPHRLAKQRARRFAIAGIEDEHAEIVQRCKIGRAPAKNLKVIALGLLEPALLAQQPGAFGARGNIVGSALERTIKLADAKAPVERVANVRSRDAAVLSGAANQRR